MLNLKNHEAEKMGGYQNQYLKVPWYQKVLFCGFCTPKLPSDGSAASPTSEFGPIAASAAAPTKAALNPKLEQRSQKTRHEIQLLPDPLKAPRHNANKPLGTTQADGQKHQPASLNVSELGHPHTDLAHPAGPADTSSRGSNRLQSSHLPQQSRLKKPTSASSRDGPAPRIFVPGSTSCPVRPVSGAATPNTSGHSPPATTAAAGAGVVAATTSNSAASGNKRNSISQSYAQFNPGKRYSQAQLPAQQRTSGHRRSHSSLDMSLASADNNQAGNEDIFIDANSSLDSASMQPTQPTAARDAREPDAYKSPNKLSLDTFGVANEDPQQSGTVQNQYRSSTGPRESMAPSSATTEEVSKFASPKELNASLQVQIRPHFAAAGMSSSSAFSPFSNDFNSPNDVSTPTIVDPSAAAVRASDHLNSPFKWQELPLKTGQLHHGEKVQSMYASFEPGTPVQEQQQQNNLSSSMIAGAKKLNHQSHIHQQEQKQEEPRGHRVQTQQQPQGPSEYPAEGKNPPTTGLPSAMPAPSDNIHYHEGNDWQGSQGEHDGSTKSGYTHRTYATAHSKAPSRAPESSHDPLVHHQMPTPAPPIGASERQQLQQEPLPMPNQITATRQAQGSVLSLMPSGNPLETPWRTRRSYSTSSRASSLLFSISDKANNSSSSHRKNKSGSSSSRSPSKLNKPLPRPPGSQTQQQQQSQPSNSRPSSAMAQPAAQPPVQPVKASPPQFSGPPQSLYAPDMPVNTPPTSFEGSVTTTSESTRDNRVTDGVVVNLNGALFQAVFPYKPALDDELALTPKEVVRVYQVFDDGWCFAKKEDHHNKSIAQGICPKVCLNSL